MMLLVAAAVIVLFIVITLIGMSIRDKEWMEEAENERE